MNPPASDAPQLIVNKAVKRFSLASPDRVAAHLSEILSWNATVGLVSRTDPAGACERLLLESLELDRLLDIDPRARIADVGSGAGFPGVVWALQQPDARIVLMERHQKKSAFLERVCRALKITHASVLAADVRESTGPAELRGTFDLVVAMAVGDPADSAPQLEWLLAPGGRFATTISRERIAPSVVGRALHHLHTIEGEFGRYAVYRAGV